MADEGKMAKTKATLTMLLCLYLVSNRIGKKGCQYLKKGVWPNLSKLNIGNCFSILRGYIPRRRRVSIVN